MKRLGFLMGIVAILTSVAICREPQKIRVTYESYIPEGWIAWDQFGTHGMGDTRDDAIADCKSMYASKLKRMGIQMDEHDGSESKATVSVDGCKVTLQFASEKEARYWASQVKKVGLVAQPLDTNQSR
jgi:hypothetical protein